MPPWIVATTDWQRSVAASPSPSRPASAFRTLEAALVQAAMQSLRSIGLPVYMYCVHRDTTITGETLKAVQGKQSAAVRAEAAKTKGLQEKMHLLP